MMHVNTSTVQQGHNLTVFVGVSNALDKMNNVTGASDWKLTDKSESGLSFNCADSDPFRVEILKGYYDSNNFTSGTPLVFTVFEPPFGYNQCLIYVSATMNSAPPISDTIDQNLYVFKPLSDQAQWIATGPQLANQPAVMSENDLLRPIVFSNSTGIFTYRGWG